MTVKPAFFLDPVTFSPSSTYLQAQVKPSCGRLVGFSSGPVNPHGVTAVISGRRCALALWFTKEKLYRDMVSIMMAAHTADLLLRSDLSLPVMWLLVS